MHADAGITGVGETDASPHVAKALVNAPEVDAVARALSGLVVVYSAEIVPMEVWLEARGTMNDHLLWAEKNAFARVQVVAAAMASRR